MKRTLENRTTLHRLLGFALAASLALPLHALAASVTLANAPLATATTSNVKPNVMFLFDDSMSMSDDYLPDWASGGGNPLLHNSVYNGVYYNDAVRYQPPVFYDAAGILDTTTYPSQTGTTVYVSTSNHGSGADATTKPNWKAVINDGYCVESGCGTTSNLVGNASFYTFVPGEYCTTADLKVCTTTSVATGLYTYPAPFRWCDTGAHATAASPAAGTCQAAHTGSFSNARYPGNGSAPGSNVLTNIVSTNNSYPYPGTPSPTTKATGRTDCTGTTCTYIEEMTNYANWWTYYHTRVQALKTSVSRAFQKLDNHYRVGFTLFGNTGVADTAGSGFLHVDTFELAQKNKWFKQLFAATTNSSTPTRGSLSKVGRYYAHVVTAAGTPDPMQYSCQQNFAIIGTDGTWNYGGESAGTYGPIGLDGSNVGDQDGGTTPRPYYEGDTVKNSATNRVNSLADVAKYYYDTDLRTSILTNCDGGISPDYPSGNIVASGKPGVCDNNVFTSSSDAITTQHMTTFTLGLGVDDALVYDPDYLNETATTGGDYYNILHNSGTPHDWTNPDISNGGVTNVAGRIDDVWHAAVNGHGQYFSAKNPDDIVSGFSTALASISAKLGSAAAAATSTLNPVAGNNAAYVASYTTVNWTGNLESRGINTATGVISDTATWCVEDIQADSCKSPGTIVTDTSGSSTVKNCVVTGTTLSACPSPGVFDGVSTCTTQISAACTGTLPAMVGAATDTRTIYTAPAGGLTPLTGQNLVPFDAAFATANPTNFAAAHVNTLNQWTSISSLHTGTKLINYLRGQNGKEDRIGNAERLYRVREATLGDALESQPFFIANPVFSYSYAGYSGYSSAKASRAGTVFMGTNDGMLHAFVATTNAALSPPEVGGVERWAYVPSMVIPNMWHLASSDYATHHVNYVNGSPIISDVCTATNCATATASDWKTILVGGLNGGGRGYYAMDITDPATPVLLWEFTTTSDSDVGYSYGRPVIARKADGKWVVLITSGYNNTSPGTGVGFLYVLNAGTGAIISKISTGVGNTTTPSGLAKIAAWNDDPIGNQAGFVYGGDLLGNLWRFNINDTGTAATIGTGSVLKFATLFSDTGGTAPQPITTTPIMGKVSTKPVIFIGTGKYLETGDLTSTQTQSLYAIKDDGATTTLVNPRAHTATAPKMVQQTITQTSGSAVRTGSTNEVDFTVDQGWFLDFPDGVSGGGSGAERVNIDGELVLGTLIVPTIVPSNSVCSPGGYGWLNFFDYKNGKPVTNSSSSTSVSVKYNSTIVGINVIYIDGKAITEVVTSDNPTPTKDTRVTISGPPGVFSGKRVIWHELTPP